MLTIDEFTQWMTRELSSNMKLYGGVSFIDALPMSTICSGLHDICCSRANLCQSVNNKVDQQSLKKLVQEEVDKR